MAENQNEIHAVKKEVSFLQKIVKEFISIPEDISIKDYIIHKKLIPGLKYLASDLVNMCLFGNERGSYNRPVSNIYNGGTKVRTSVNMGMNEQTNYSRQANTRPTPMNGNVRFDGILVPDPGQANALVDQIVRAITSTAGSGNITIKEVYEMANIPIKQGESNPLDAVYGWASAEGIVPRPYNDQFWEVVFPKPVKVR